jgi:hypothetical protein
MTESTEQTNPHFYQALGIVEGILDTDNTPYTLTAGKTIRPAIVSKKVRLEHQPGQKQYFRVYPNVRDGKIVFKLIAVTRPEPTVFVLKGCWDTHNDEPRLIVYRNRIKKRNNYVLSIPIPIAWENAPVSDGKFWELEAELRGNKLTVVKAEGPFDPPPKATRYEPPAIAPCNDKTAATPTPTAKVKPTTATPPPTPTAQAQTTATPLTIQEIRDMATPAKISLTCKLNQVPVHRELPDKQIEFFLNDGADRIFTVRMKPKLFKKLTDHGFAQWVAAISGDLGPATETGFELLNPAVQVFEKKGPADTPAGQEKALATEAKAAAAVARHQSPKAEAQAGAGKRKSLLDGVRIK